MGSTRALACFGPPSRAEVRRQQIRTSPAYSSRGVPRGAEHRTRGRVRSPGIFEATDWQPHLRFGPVTDGVFMRLRFVANGLSVNGGIRRKQDDGAVGPLLVCFWNLGGANEETSESQH